MYDEPFMRIALNLARRRVGMTAPNPSVACVIVKKQQIISTGITGVGGRPHAETIALNKAGNKAKGATMYVTLEPCAHKGQTPPCTKEIIKAGISKIIIATEDSYEKVSGRGIKELEKAGIEIIINCCESEARQLNEGFFKIHEKKLPFVTVKMATSIDGKISTKTGESKWITSEQARNYAHVLRAKNDAILVGIGTILADDPKLDCRLPGLEHNSPTRVVIDKDLKIPIKSKLVKSAKKIPLWVITTIQSSKKKQELEKKGTTIITINSKVKNIIEPKTILGALAKKGITRLLIEGGGKTNTNFVKANLVDKIIWIRAPIIIGNEGGAAIEGLNNSKLKLSTKLILIGTRSIGPDNIEIYEKIEK